MFVRGAALPYTQFIIAPMDAIICSPSGAYATALVYCAPVSVTLLSAGFLVYPATDAKARKNGSFRRPA